MSPIPVFGIDVSHSGATATLTLRGDLDLGTVPQLSSRFDALDAFGRRAGVAHVVVDLSHLSFLDVSGARELVRGNAMAPGSGHSFSLVRGTGIVDRMMDLTGFGERFTYVLGEAPAAA